MQPRRGIALAYLKAEVRSRSPRLWGWGLHRDGSDNLIKGSAATYGCAEDAWKSGRAALASFEAAAQRSPATAGQEEVAS